MEIADAQVLVRTYLDFGFLFNLGTERSMSLEEEAGNKLRRGLAEALIRLDVNFMDEIRRDFPDLLPADLR